MMDWGQEKVCLDILDNSSFIFNIFEIKYVMHFGDDAVRNQTRKDQNFDQIRNKKQQGEKVGRPAPENALVFEDR